jgi:hypothetical protein
LTEPPATFKAEKKIAHTKRSQARGLAARFVIDRKPKKAFHLFSSTIGDSGKTVVDCRLNLRAARVLD